HGGGSGLILSRSSCAAGPTFGASTITVITAAVPWSTGKATPQPVSDRSARIKRAFVMAGISRPPLALGNRGSFVASAATGSPAGCRSASASDRSPCTASRANRQSRSPAADQAGTPLPEALAEMAQEALRTPYSPQGSRQRPQSRQDALPPLGGQSQHFLKSGLRPIQRSSAPQRTRRGRRNLRGRGNGLGFRRKQRCGEIHHRLNRGQRG